MKISNHNDVKWADIVGYEGIYQVSNKGQIKSLTRSIKQGSRMVTIKERILKQCHDSNDYRMVVLAKDGISTSFRVHRLVATAFISNPYNKKEVNHINGNKSDNSIKNLEWNTRIENMYHALTNGLSDIPPKPVERKISQFTTFGAYVTTFNSIKHAGQSTSVNQTDICKCCKGKRKTAGGYVWKYINESEAV